MSEKTIKETNFEYADSVVNIKTIIRDDGCECGKSCNEKTIIKIEIDGKRLEIQKGIWKEIVDEYCKL